MKNSITHSVLAASAVVGAVLLPSSAHADIPSVYESYDRNPLGDMVGQPSGGYGVTGNYYLQGSASSGAFSIVPGGLAFGNFNLITDASRCVQVNANATATGVGIRVDGGKAYGDTDFYYYDKVYCSYLVNFTNVSNLAAGRAEVRASSAESGGTLSMQVHMDASAVAQPTPPALLSPLPVSNAAATGANTIQPALAYTGGTYARVPTTSAPVDNSLVLGTTYMMIGRFNNVGNALNVSRSSTWDSGSRNLTVTPDATGIQVGQIAIGTGIADYSVVTGVNGTTVTLDKNTTAAGSATSVGFHLLVGDLAMALVSPANNIPTLTASATVGNISAGMIATGTGIPANTTVTGTSTSGGNLIISLNAPVTVASGTLVTFRSITPITASWSANSNIITVTHNPGDIGIPGNTGIQVGQHVRGAGLPENAIVSKVQAGSGGNTTITINSTTTSAGSAGVYFFTRSGTSSLFALTYNQYLSFRNSGSTDAERNAYLDATPMGRGDNQISVKITGPVVLSGNIEFGHGRFVHLVAHGATGSNQTYKFDELRYGPSLMSVTQPTAVLPVPANDVAAFDDMTNRFERYLYNGYGWKSGYYEIEETAGTQGARGLTNTSGAEIVQGSGHYLDVVTRAATNTDQGIRRRPDPMVVDMSKPYTLSFDYKVTSGESTFTQFADRIQIGADVQIAGTTGAVTQSSNLGPNPTRPGLTPTQITAGTGINWMIGVVGNSDGDRPMYPGRWYFWDMDGATRPSDANNYFVRGNMVLASDDNDSDPDNDYIPAIGAGIYSFKIEVNPQTYTYRATIYLREHFSTPENQVKKFSKGGLRFRDNVPADAIFWGVSKSNNEFRSFALDNLRVVQGVDFFPDWIATFPSITGSANKLRTADPDQDGRKNFLEYALDGNPSSGASSGKISTTVSTIASSQYHTLTLPVRSGFTFSAGTETADLGSQVSTYTQPEGIKYKIQGSYDLTNWNAQVVEVTPALATSPALTTSPGWTYKTFRLAQPVSPTHPKGFLRAVVETTK